MFQDANTVRLRLEAVRFRRMNTILSISIGIVALLAGSIAAKWLELETGAYVWVIAISVVAVIGGLSRGGVLAATFGHHAKAMKLVNEAVDSPPETRAVLFSHAVALDPDKGLAQIQGYG